VTEVNILNDVYIIPLPLVNISCSFIHRQFHYSSHAGMSFSECIVEKSKDLVKDPKL